MMRGIQEASVETENNINTFWCEKGATYSQKRSLNTEFWPWVFDRLIPVNSQVVIESCKGTFFTYHVVSLKQRVLVHWAVTLNHSGVIMKLSEPSLYVYYCFDSPVACFWGASRQFDIWPQPAFRKLGTRSDFIAVHVTVVILLT